MEMYKSEEVLDTVKARIYPTDNRIPECNVVIRLTSSHVFISEDNYDGTFEDHYILDVPQIKEIKIDSPYKTSIGYSGTSLDGKADKGKTHWMDGFMGGLFSFEGTKGHRGLHKDKAITKSKFLEIVYRENYEKIEHLYFDQCNKSPESLIKAFNKMKEGY